MCINTKDWNEQQVYIIQKMLLSSKSNIPQQHHASIFSIDLTRMYPCLNQHQWLD